MWDEQLRLLVHVPELQSLHVDVRDWDLLNASDHIGRCGPLLPANPGLELKPCTQPQP